MAVLGTYPNTIVPQVPIIWGASERHSLARNQEVFYAKTHICELNAEEALQCLTMLIAPQYLAGTFYFREIFKSYLS